MLRLALCLAAGLVIQTPALHGQGLLEHMRLGTHHGPDAPSPSPAPHESTSAQSPAVAGLGAGAAEGLGYAAIAAAVVATSPFWGPHFLLGDSLRIPGYFPGHPYALWWTGYLTSDYNGFHPTEDQKARFWDADFLKTWAVRLAFDDSNNFSGLNRVTGTAFLDTTYRLGLLTRWQSLHEDTGGGRSDDSLLGDIELTFRFVQREWLLMHTGLGVRVLADRSDPRAGFNFLYGADLFVLNPVVLSTVLDLGNLDAAFVVHARATIGIVLSHCELLAGYDFLRIGPVNLQGPVVGLRLWF